VSWASRPQPMSSGGGAASIDTSPWRATWSRDQAACEAGSMTIDWGDDGPDRETAERVLIAILLGAMTEG
jgi:hypothetical protein